MTFKTFLFGHKSAWLPMLMSLAALLWLLGFLVFGGIPQARPTDEGVGAHVFQLLMGGQLPIILYFAVRYIPESPRLAFLVLMLQFLLGVLAFLPVRLLNL